MDEALWHRLAVSLGIGLVVGLERGWKTRAEHGGRRPAGLRTFALTGLLGGVLAALSEPDHLAVLAVGAAVVGGLVLAGYLLGVGKSADLGLTTEVALLATFGLGALAVLRAPLEAAAASVVMALVLGLKTETHAAVARLERRELLATLKLAAIAAVLVPVLPDEDLGPWNAVNPRTVGLLVLLIASVSYVGYFAVRLLGSRLGLLLTAFFGGLSSSTAVTAAYARRARSEVAHRPLLGAGIALAAATMSFRLAVEIAAVNRDLLSELWPTLAALSLAPLIATAYVARRTPGPATDVELSNPLELGTALTFGGLLILIFIAAEALRSELGVAGAYATAAIAGLVDVDAVGVAFASAASRNALEPATASRAVALAVFVNTAAKAAMAAVLGGPALLRSASAVLLAGLLCGIVTAAFTLS